MSPAQWAARKQWNALTIDIGEHFGSVLEASNKCNTDFKNILSHRLEIYATCLQYR